MKYLLLPIFGLFIYSNVLAQSVNSQPTPILLNNHKITSGEVDLDVSGVENQLGSIYRIVNDANFKLGQEYGPIRVLEFLPKRAFIVSIDKRQLTAAGQILNERGATAVLEFQPEWKLSPNLFTLSIPDWAWLDNQNIKVWVSYYSDLIHNDIKQKLTDAGYQVIDSKEDQNLLAVAINPDNVINLAAMPFAAYVQEMEDPGSPENYTAYTNHRVNTLQSSYAGSVYFDGTGVVVGHGDDGALGEHVDFTGRVSGLLGNNNGDHGDHVAGTIFGAGNKHPRTRGMAPGAEIYYQDYPANLNDADQNFTTQNVRITSSSYSNGCNAGYTNFTQQMDQDAVDHPEMIHIFSAGNNGGSNCGYGAGSGWGNVTGGHKIAKNVIAVANLSRTDGLATSSSRGPAADGRIKPDIGAVGTQVYSTTDQPSPNSYTTKSGTSMACPGVSGTMATLYQAYREYNGGQDPHAGLLKAIVMNTADDLGNAGPDFRYGYGRINARRAHELIKNGQYISGSISSGTNTHNITIPSGNYTEVRIMLYWPDPPSFPGAQRSLINDLDMEVSAGGSTYLPWVLDPTPNSFTLGQPAVMARDSLNNIEQVTFAPGTGTISIDVKAFNVPSANQEYFVVYEFVKDEITLTYPLGGEGFAPTQFEYIRWDAEGNGGTFTLEYSIDNGSNWTTISSSISGSNRHAVWTVPNTPSDMAKMRVIRGTDTSETPGTFVIAELPYNLQVETNCPDSLVLTWNGVSNVDGYTVYRLGNKYMDSIGYSTDTFAIITKSDPTVNHWYSIAPVINGKSGQRIIAIEQPANTPTCIIDRDLEVTSVVSPAPGTRAGCLTNTPEAVEIKVTNNGNNNVSNFYVGYSYNGGPAVIDTIPGPLNSGLNINHIFSGTITLAGGITTLKVWVDYTIDQNRYNDTVLADFEVSNTVVYIPYFNDFESFDPCGTATDCGVTECDLKDGFVNLQNGAEDDIDFRTHSGSTSSSNTGPTIDLNPGTTSGNYVYTEASGGCDSSEAIMWSPCLFIDTSMSVIPTVKFGYHMSGGNVGKLDVDIITDNGVDTKVIPTVSGNQGALWKIAQIDLTPYHGHNVVVQIRAKTGNGFQSDIAIDDFQFIDNSVAAPVAGFTYTGGPCAQDTFTFTDNSIGNVGTYLWDFGPDAVPATATTAGPHKVYYTSGGLKTVKLDVTNGGGTDDFTQGINTTSHPITNFTYSVNMSNVNFVDVSSFQPTSWSWDFGDGNTSTQQNPGHYYSSTGKFPVTLTATNSCGSESYVDTVEIITVGIDELGILNDVELFPNPTTGKVQITVPSKVSVKSVLVTDVRGSVIRNISEGLNKGQVEFNLGDYPVGVYFVELNTELGKRTFKLIRK